MANYVRIKASGTTLPSPVVLRTSDELIWSANTGRSTDTGNMIGDIVARKQTIEVEWGVITKSERDTIRSAVNGSAFFNVKLELVNGSSTTELADFTCYRSELAADILGVFGGTMYYKGAKVSLIQK